MLVFVSLLLEEYRVYMISWIFLTTIILSFYSDKTCIICLCVTKSLILETISSQIYWKTALNYSGCRPLASAAFVI